MAHQFARGIEAVASNTLRDVNHGEQRRSDDAGQQ